MDNCCCENVGGNDCSDDITRCGPSPMVIEMTGKYLNFEGRWNNHYLSGSEAEIICGEWETGQFLSQDEEYNIILPIMEVIRCNQHPTGKELWT